jgi:hypothetical protein
MKQVCPTQSVGMGLGSGAYGQKKAYALLSFLTFSYSLIKGAHNEEIT